MYKQFSGVSRPHTIVIINLMFWSWNIDIYGKYIFLMITFRVNESILNFLLPPLDYSMDFPPSLPPSPFPPVPPPSPPLSPFKPRKPPLVVLQTET